MRAPRTAAGGLTSYYSSDQPKGRTRWIGNVASGRAGGEVALRAPRTLTPIKQIKESVSVGRSVGARQHALLQGGGGFIRVNNQSVSGAQPSAARKLRGEELLFEFFPAYLLIINFRPLELPKAAALIAEIPQFESPRP